MYGARSKPKFQPILSYNLEFLLKGNRYKKLGVALSFFFWVLLDEPLSMSIEVN
jgi:hypothetical protein